MNMPQAITQTLELVLPIADFSTLQLGMGWLTEDFGGLNRVYYESIKYLPTVGVGVQGLVAGTGDRVQQESHGVVQAFAPYEAKLWQRWGSLWRSTKQLLNSQQPDLVVSHFAFYTFPILPLLGDRPLVVHFQGPWALESTVEGRMGFSSRLKAMLESATYKRASQFIVLSAAFRQVLHQQYQVPLARIHIVPPGVEVERFDVDLSPTMARQQLGWPQDRPILLSVRRLAKRMGLENLIAAIAQVRCDHPDVLLLIAGKGELAAELQQQITELDLTDNVRLLGFLPDEDLPLAYRAANLSVVPTVAYEGFGLIIPESLAAGTPVLGTPVDAIPEILAPLSTDLLCAGTTSQDLALAIDEILSGQRVLPSAMACQAYVQANYAWPVVAQRMRQVYELALSSSVV
jgi:glycosyltransferase involved in cell wall biosynthesis